MNERRHADRLYARLAGGAELTGDERRHVARCAACRQAVAHVEQLDERLRMAATWLASEPIPEADLEPLEAPSSGWNAPLAAIVAVGVVGIAIGVALGQLRPPTGADATPSPSSLAAETATPSPSVTPTPSPTPQAVASADAVPLASGGQPCADGAAGFSIVVPDGWYANLRQGDLMACAFLAPEPFDPFSAAGDPEYDAAIRLTTSIDAAPAGTVVHQGGDGSTWTVEREGEQWVVDVVELNATFGGQPAYLHLATRAADEATTDVLQAIRERLHVGEPMSVDADAAAQAEALFADADVCSDLNRGVNVILPDEWWTNTAFGDLQPCTYFAPGPFEIGEAGTIPDGVAIMLEVITGNMATIEEILGYETLVVDRRAGVRWELTPGLGNPPPDTRTYQYEVPLDDTPDNGPSLLLTLSSQRSDDYERDKAVLDEMVRRLTISPTPASVLDSDPLPSCGWELVERTPQGDRHDPEARGCLWDAFQAGERAEMVSTGLTVEGAVVRQVYRILGRNEIAWIVDATHDPLSSGGWHMMRCATLDRLPADDEVTGAILFAPNACDPPTQLSP
jgi:hypothetical protein